MGTVYCGFPSLSGGNSRVLILGTFPSPMSREKAEYYGNPRNQFWRIMHGVFGEPYGSIVDYGQKKPSYTQTASLCGT